MSYRQEMGRLAREVAKLLNEGGKVPGADIRAAVAGHSSLVGLLRAIQGDLSTTEWRGVTDLGVELARQPRINEQALTSVIQSQSVSRAGAIWRNVAKLATVADHDWRQSTQASRPYRDTAWSEVADIASLSEAVGLLDGDIADSLAAVGRLRDASDFRSSQSGLIAIAQEVRRLAGTGPLPTAAELQPTPTDTVIPVPTQEALPDALKQLSALVNSANNLPPAQVELISRVIAETAIATATALKQPGDRAPSALRAHADRISAVFGHTKHVAPLRMGSGRAIAQAQRIHQMLRDLHLRHLPLSPRVARPAASALPSITKALTESAERQVAHGLWLISREGNGPLRWTPSLGSADEPQILAKLRYANKHGPTVSKYVDLTPKGARPKHHASPTPRKVLAGPLAERGSPVPIVRATSEMHRRR